MKTEETQDMLFRIVLISILVGNAILIVNIQVMGDIVPIGIMLSFLCILLFLNICIVTDIDQIFSLFIRGKIRSYMGL